MKVFYKTAGSITYSCGKFLYYEIPFWRINKREARAQRFNLAICPPKSFSMYNNIERHPCFNEKKMSVPKVIDSIYSTFLNTIPASSSSISIYCRNNPLKLLGKDVNGETVTTLRTIDNLSDYLWESIVEAIFHRFTLHFQSLNLKNYGKKVEGKYLWVELESGVIRPLKTVNNGEWDWDQAREFFNETTV